MFVACSVHVIDVPVQTGLCPILFPNEKKNTCCNKAGGHVGHVDDKPCQIG